MSASQVSNPKGTRDFTPEVMAKRNYLISTIARIFASYGYQPIETPAVETLSTLLGKYGEEGDRLIFKILNSGEFLKKLDKQAVEQCNNEKAATSICERGLRYDLTVPFARYVVQHRHETPMPFKRYQIQPVWRADRPQKGRYREFYQCDIDVIGTTSLLNELELILVAQDVFAALGMKVELLFNNRKLLAAMAEAICAPSQLTDITVAIDKLDKVGLEAVEEELKSKGLSDVQIQALRPMITVTGTAEEKLQALAPALTAAPSAELGMQEVRELLSLLQKVQLTMPVRFDLSLARGLNYYTGTIFEVKSTEGAMGSICGGGRYDNLTGIFGLKDMSGVGISFGIERIYDLLESLQRFPTNTAQGPDLLVLNLDPQALPALLELTQATRKAGLKTLLYPETANFKRQLDYANKLSIPWVAIVGERELAQGEVSLKNMLSGEQTAVKLQEAPAWLMQQAFPTEIMH